MHGVSECVGLASAYRSASEDRATAAGACRGCLPADAIRRRQVPDGAGHGRPIRCASMRFEQACHRPCQPARLGREPVCGSRAQDVLPRGRRSRPCHRSAPRGSRTRHRTDFPVAKHDGVRAAMPASGSSTSSSDRAAPPLLSERFSIARSRSSSASAWSTSRTTTPAGCRAAGRSSSRSVIPSRTNGPPWVDSVPLQARLQEGRVAQIEEPHVPCANCLENMQRIQRQDVRLPQVLGAVGSAGDATAIVGRYGSSPCLVTDSL